jgi:hypothetical protein
LIERASAALAARAAAVKSVAVKSLNFTTIVRLPSG